jgi:hypothetical protein
LGRLPGNSEKPGNTEKEGAVMAKLRWLTIVVLGAGALMVVSAPSAGAAGVCSPSTPQYCPAPQVVTTVATAITSNSAVLNGTVNPNGAPTTCFFEYGTSSSYSVITIPKGVGSGTASVPFSAAINGLNASTLFHFQLVCTSAGGGGLGGDRTFSTTDHGPSAIKLSGHTGFVSPKGVAGVFIGCYGDRACTGSLTVKRGSTVIGSRKTYTIAHNSGGIIHLTISSSALKALKKLGHYDVTVSSTTTDGQNLQPGDNGFTVTFHIFK